MYAPYQHLGCLTPIQHRGARVWVAGQREGGGMPKCKGCLSDVRASGASRFQGSDSLPRAMGMAHDAGRTAVGDVRKTVSDKSSGFYFFFHLLLLA
jgi:hypothetical protein